MKLNKNIESLPAVPYSNNISWFGVISKKKCRSCWNKVTGLVYNSILNMFRKSDLEFKVHFRDLGI